MNTTVRTEYQQAQAYHATPSSDTFEGLRQRGRNAEFHHEDGPPLAHPPATKRRRLRGPIREQPPVEGTEDDSSRNLNAIDGDAIPLGGIAARISQPQQATSLTSSTQLGTANEIVVSRSAETIPSQSSTQLPARRSTPGAASTPTLLQVLSSQRKVSGTQPESSYGPATTLGDSANGTLDHDASAPILDGNEVSRTQGRVSNSKTGAKQPKKARTAPKTLRARSSKEHRATGLEPAVTRFDDHVDTEPMVQIVAAHETAREPTSEPAAPPKQRKPRNKIVPLSSDSTAEDQAALGAEGLQASIDAEVTPQQASGEQGVRKKRGPYKKRKNVLNEPSVAANEGAETRHGTADETAPQRKKRKYTKRAAKWFATQSTDSGPADGAAPDLDSNNVGARNAEEPVVPKQRRAPKPRPKNDQLSSVQGETNGALAEEQLADSEGREVRETEEGEDEQQEEDGEEEDGDGDGPPRQKKRGRKRAKTPEDAEAREIDASTMTMFDLCRDRKQGKKSKLEAEFQSIDWVEVVKRRKENEARARAAGIKASDQAREAMDEAGEHAPAPIGPQLRLRNGEIVLDTSSLVVNRHVVPNGVAPAVEESDLTKRVNSSTWMFDNRRDPADRFYQKSDKWTAYDTDVFYGALKMFGTDFDMISKMFPGRTRRMIKHKFTREERQNEHRIRAVLLGQPDPMSLATYCEMTGKTEDDYKDPEALAEELREDEERQRAAIEREREEQLELQKKKQEAAQAKAEAAIRRKAGEKVPRKKRKRKGEASEEQQQGDGAAATNNTEDGDGEVANAAVDEAQTSAGIDEVPGGEITNKQNSPLASRSNITRAKGRGRRPKGGAHHADTAAATVDNDARERESNRDQAEGGAEDGTDHGDPDVAVPTVETVS